jgi:hypothetical protein
MAAAGLAVTVGSVAAVVTQPEQGHRHQAREAERET